MTGLLKKLRDPDRDVYERRYLLLTALFSVELLAVVFVYLFGGFPQGLTLMYGVCAFMNIWNYLWVINGRNLQLTCVRNSAFVILVYIPLGFFFGGGIRAGAAYWCIIVMLYVFWTVRGRARNHLMILYLVVTLSCLAACAFEPHWMYRFDSLHNTINYVMLVVLNMLILMAGLFYQVFTADQERVLIEEQKIKINELNRERVKEAYGRVNQGQKRPVAVSCDSAADLPPDWYALWDIRVIRHVLHTEHGSFRDGTEINGDELLFYMRNETKTATSEVPDAAQFEVFFAKLSEEAERILHISIAEDSSPVFRAASEAAGRFPNVTVIDSGSMSGGAGLLVLYAAQLAKETSLTADEILLRLLYVKGQITARFILENTSYLLRGGRMTPLLSRWMDAFMLHPTINMKDDRMNFFVAVSVNYRRSFIRHVLADRKRIDTSLLMITYAGVEEETLSVIREEVEKCVRFDRVIVMPTSGAVAVNVGPGTFGLMFHVLGEDKETGGRLFDFLRFSDPAPDDGQQK